MVLYTPQARSLAGGQAIMVDRIRRAVADMNGALANSRVNATVRLVHQQEVDYDDVSEGNLRVHHHRLHWPDDGYLDEVADLVARYGADRVSLWTGPSDGFSGGVSGQPSVTEGPTVDFGVPGNVLVSDLANGRDFVFAHEMGHTLGAGHPRAAGNTEDRGYYQYGYSFDVAGTYFGDVMSSGQVHVPYFSNPRVRFRGVPMGVEELSDNARAINIIAPRVADAEPTIVADAAPAAALGPVLLARRGRALRVHVYLADDVAVDVATLSRGDIRLASGGASAGLAQLIRVDHANPGAQRTAVYEIPLTRPATSPAGFAFDVEPGAIRDTAGRAVPPGRLAAPTADFADRAGRHYGDAYELGNFTAAAAHVADHVGGGHYFRGDADNYYRFTLKKAAYVSARLTGLPGYGGLRVVTDPHVPGGSERSPLAFSKSAGTIVQTLSVKLRRGTYYLIAGAHKRHWQYTLTLATGRRPHNPATAAATSAAAQDPTAGRSGVSGSSVPTPPSVKGITDPPPLKSLSFDGRMGLTKSQDHSEGRR